MKSFLAFLLFVSFFLATILIGVRVGQAKEITCENLGGQKLILGLPDSIPEESRNFYITVSKIGQHPGIKVSLEENGEAYFSSNQTDDANKMIKSKSDYEIVLDEFNRGPVDIRVDLENLAEAGQKIQITTDFGSCALSEDIFVVVGGGSDPGGAVSNVNDVVADGSSIEVDGFVALLDNIIFTALDGTVEVGSFSVNPNTPGVTNGNFTLSGNIDLSDGQYTVKAASSNAGDLGTWTISIGGSSTSTSSPSVASFQGCDDCDCDCSKYAKVGGVAYDEDDPGKEDRCLEDEPACLARQVECLEEFEACTSCVLTVPTNPNSEPTGSIWTEIGCVDPSPAGLVTRAFQIGVGIMSGVAILRIFQIIMIYQGDDPQKKQEAPGMAWSLAGGILLLAVGLILLRFLGINVIGLPDRFLGR